VAPLLYVDVVTDLVHALKFRGSRTHGRVLATILAASVERTYEASPPPSAIVPVPLSTRRLLARGQNQAAVIARRVGGELGIAVDYDSLRRIRHTAPQTGMTRRERLRNLAGAFDYRGALDGATVAIVDDVVTTGATVRAVARCLERHGAGDVHVWAVARTDRGDAT
jgi:ComF family protein